MQKKVNTSQNQSKTISSDTLAGLSTSILIHFVFILVFILQKPTQFKENYEDVATVDLEQFFEKKKSPETPKIQPQIASDTKSDIKPQEDVLKKFLAEKDSDVKKEQVKRGDPGNPSVGKSQDSDQRPASKPSQQSKESISRVKEESRENAKPDNSEDKPSQVKKEIADTKKPASVAEKVVPKDEQQIIKKESQTIKSLTLDNKSLMALNEKLAEENDSQDSEEKETNTKNETTSSNKVFTSLTNKTRPLGDFKPFSRPTGSGAQVLGSGGVRDYLPNLPDGDITMLNAKADHFAVFVRRVATRVFTQLRSSGWENLSSNEIATLSSFTTITAELSLKGELLKVTLESPSGSNSFDQVVATSVKKGARDPNPPPEAVSANGNIKFIFKSRSWIAGGYSTRSGAPIERRWLLLGVGLE